MKLITKRKKKGKLILKLIFLAGIIYVISTLVGQQILVQDKKNKLQELSRQNAVQKLKNEELENSLNSENEDSNKRIERIARGLGYAKEGETVFEVAKGNK